MVIIVNLSVEGRSAAAMYSCKYIEVSATIDLHIDELFVGVIRQIRAETRRHHRNSQRHQHHRDTANHHHHLQQQQQQQRQHHHSQRNKRNQLHVYLHVFRGWSNKK